MCFCRTKQNRYIRLNMDTNYFIFRFKYRIAFAVLIIFGSYSVVCSQTISLGNVAMGKTATQSSVANGGIASRAVDGNTDGRAVWNSVTETAGSDNNPWWQVDLGKTYSISLVEIWNRTDCCSDKMNNFTVSILDSSKQVVWTRKINYFPNPSVTLDGANTKGQYIKVQLNGPGPLYLAEVMVFSWKPSSFINVALKKEAAESSIGDNAPASRAVDGNSDGDWVNGSVSHTTQEDNPWWQVDLGKSYAINQIRIWNRTDGWDDRLNNFTVSILDSNKREVWVKAKNIVPRPALLLNVGLISGRFVKVQINSANAILQLAEVQVFADTTLPLQSYSNVALKKDATQSITGEGGVASRAVDVNSDGNWFASQNSVTHTGNYSDNPWWQVDLGKSYTISAIQMFNRTDCCMDRLSKYTISILDSSKKEVWSNYQALYPTPSILFNTGIKRGRFVKIQINGLGILSIAEVQVFSVSK